MKVFNQSVWTETFYLLLRQVILIGDICSTPGDQKTQLQGHVYLLFTLICVTLIHVKNKLFDSLDNDIKLNWTFL